MAEKKSGPVKPPIIDAQARPAEKPEPEKPGPNPAQTAPMPGDKPAATKPEDAPKPQATKPSAAAADQAGAGPNSAFERQAPKEDAPQKDAPKPQAARSAEPPKAAPPPAREPAPIPPWLPLLGASAAGALIGFGLAWGAASLGYWPDRNSAAQGDLAELQTRTGQLEDALALREAEAADTSARIAELSNQFAAIEPAEPVSTEGLAAQTDLDALAGQISDLSSRIEALAAGATGDEVNQVANSLSGLTSQVSALADRLDALEPQMDQFAPALERIDALDARIADQDRFEALAADRDRALRLPGAIAALESAVESGQPFAAQLSEISSILPAFEIGEEARQVAASGALAAPQLLTEFRAAIPALLAAAPRDPEAGWAQSLFDQTVSALALRPTEGDSPQALVGRTEAALATGDLDAAHEAFIAMPEPMQAAAPAFARELGNSRLAHAVVEDVRAAEFAAGEETAQ